ncbi:MAG: tetratricopeptide repeat protein [Cyanobacteria bacterium]|nr:tetratricopeptide repeat protein [Cyanobacteriota bacterium]
MKASLQKKTEINAASSQTGRRLMMIGLVAATLVFQSLFALSAKAEYSQKTVNESLSKLSEEKKAELATLIGEGIRLEDAGDLMGAIEVNKKILTICPESVEAMATIGGLYGSLNTKEGFKEEIVWCDKAIKTNPDFANSYVNKGNALVAIGDVEGGRAQFDEAIKRDSNCAPGYYSLGVLEEQKGNFKEALARYKESVKADPNFENGYFNLAAMYGNLKQYQEAKDSLEKLLTLNPQANDARTMLKEIEAELKSSSKKPSK